ncbi:FMN-binding protein [Persephonella sp.]
MMKLLVFLLTVCLAYGGLLVKPEDALRELFPEGQIEKRSFMIPGNIKKEIEKNSGKKLRTSIFTVYLVKKNGKTVAYSLLHSHRVRTKNETLLITMDRNCSIINVEVIAFYEPPEYIPGGKWLENLKNKSPDNPPVLKKNIPVVTGATLSSRAVADASRQAVFICQYYLREKL